MSGNLFKKYDKSALMHTHAVTNARLMYITCEIENAKNRYIQAL